MKDENLNPPVRGLLAGLAMAALLGGAALAQPARDSASLLLPGHLVYQGAFRLPAGASDQASWAYGGGGLAYYPEGDPGGGGDGYPGSLFGIGHDYALMVSEIGIPRPVISASRVAGDLPVARTLQAFRSVTGGVEPDGNEVRVSGLEYLPKQGSQDRGGLYFTQGHHWMNSDSKGNLQPTHYRVSLDLANPRLEGPWNLGGHRAFNVSGYIFEIPEPWARAHVGGKRLAAGGFREHLGGSYGPCLFAYAPWEDGDPPAANARLRTVTLLNYGLPPDSMVDNKHADQWAGGAWLTAGARSAVVLLGSKGTGAQWYGIPEGSSKGWNAEPYEASILFLDPADLAKVAAGAMKPHQPQPYARLSVEERMFSRNRRYLKGTAFDRDRGILFVIEAFNATPIVHVWKVGGGSSDQGPAGLGGAASPSLRRGAEGLFLRFRGTEAAPPTLELLRPDGRAGTKAPGAAYREAGSWQWDLRGAPAGVYRLIVRSGATGRVLGGTLAVLP